ncbi:unnamed protein product [Amoebophrya sp. A25]|nr:unnamed protein product [Amoebophrya sp. A25]|eukprot:GSA25T00003075001.1
MADDYDYEKLRPADVLFMQDTISDEFQKNGGTLQELVKRLREENPTVVMKSMMIDVLRRSDGKLYSADNRRLYCLKKAVPDTPLTCFVYNNEEAFSKITEGSSLDAKFNTSDGRFITVRPKGYKRQFQKEHNNLLFERHVHLQNIEGYYEQIFSDPPTNPAPSSKRALATEKQNNTKTRKASRTSNNETCSPSSSCSSSSSSATGGGSSEAGSRANSSSHRGGILSRDKLIAIFLRKFDLDKYNLIADKIEFEKSEYEGRTLVILRGRTRDDVVKAGDKCVELDEQMSEASSRSRPLIKMEQTTNDSGKITVPLDEVEEQRGKIISEVDVEVDVDALVDKEKEQRELSVSDSFQAKSKGKKQSRNSQPREDQHVRNPGSSSADKNRPNGKGNAKPSTSSRMKDRKSATDSLSTIGVKDEYEHNNIGRENKGKNRKKGIMSPHPVCPDEVTWGRKSASTVSSSKAGEEQADSAGSCGSGNQEKCFHTRSEEKTHFVWHSSQSLISSIDRSPHQFLQFAACSKGGTSYGNNSQEQHKGTRVRLGSNVILGNVIHSTASRAQRRQLCRERLSVEALASIDLYHEETRGVENSLHQESSLEAEERDIKPSFCRALLPFLKESCSGTRPFLENNDKTRVIYMSSELLQKLLCLHTELQHSKLRTELQFYGYCDSNTGYIILWEQGEEQPPTSCAPDERKNDREQDDNSKRPASKKQEHEKCASSTKALKKLLASRNFEQAITSVSGDDETKTKISAGGCPIAVSSLNCEVSSLVEIPELAKFIPGFPSGERFCTYSSYGSIIETAATKKSSCTKKEDKDTSKRVHVRCRKQKGSKSDDVRKILYPGKPYEIYCKMLSSGCDEFVFAGHDANGRVQTLHCLESIGDFRYTFRLGRDLESAGSFLGPFFAWFLNQLRIVHPDTPMHFSQVDVDVHATKVDAEEVVKASEKVKTASTSSSQPASCSSHSGVRSCVRVIAAVADCDVLVPCMPILSELRLQWDMQRLKAKSRVKQADKCKKNNNV